MLIGDYPKETFVGIGLLRFVCYITCLLSYFVFYFVMLTLMANSFMLTCHRNFTLSVLEDNLKGFYGPRSSWGTLYESEITRTTHPCSGSFIILSPIQGKKPPSEHVLLERG